MSAAEKNAPPVALITGAAGGLGRALVAAFLEAGYRVAAGWHERPFPDDGPGNGGENLRAVRLDVTDPVSVARAVAEVEAAWDGVTALVNNAGILRDAPLWRMSVADWDAVLAVHLRGIFHCVRAGAPGMQRRGGGHIINVGSHVGLQGARGQANYAAAKAGVAGLTQSLAREWGAADIRVNAVLPGMLPTALTAGRSAAQQAAWRRANALGRTGEVAEVARFVAFLAGLRHVSGQVFALDSRPLRPW
jgi:3-oxoacyl-[acyl-carrier protein] reductase